MYKRTHQDKLLAAISGVGFLSRYRDRTGTLQGKSIEQQ
jgi:hypothetical protein